MCFVDGGEKGRGGEREGWGGWGRRRGSVKICSGYFVPEKEFTHRPTKLNRDVCFLHSGTCVFSFLVSDQGSKTHYLVKYNYIYIYI